MVHAMMDMFITTGTTKTKPVNVRNCGFFAFMLLLSASPPLAWSYRRKVMSGRWWEDEAKLYEGLPPDPRRGGQFDLMRVMGPSYFLGHVGSIWQTYISFCYDPEFFVYLERLMLDRRFKEAPNRLVTLARVVASVYNAQAVMRRTYISARTTTTTSPYLGSLTAFVRRLLKREVDFRPRFFDMISKSMVGRVTGHSGTSNDVTKLGCDRMVALWDAVAEFRPRLAHHASVLECSPEVQASIRIAIHQTTRARDVLISIQTAFRRSMGRTTPVGAKDAAGNVLPGMAPPRTRISMAPPNWFGSLFPGGASFLESMDHMYRDPLPPPHHATPVALAELVSKPFYATPKADGVPFVGTLPDGIYPPPPPGTKIRAEVLEVPGLGGAPTTVYLVYDVLPNYHEPAHAEDEDASDDEDECPFGDRPAGLDLGGRLGLLQSPTAADLPTKIHRHNGEIKQLLRSGHPVVWAVKPVHRMCGAQCLPTFDKQPGTFYPNDGWVVSPATITLRDQLAKNVPTLKIKPAHEMTADLLIEGTVMRCTYVSGPDTGSGPDTKWVPREARVDKKTCNPPHLVEFLERWHQNPWCPSDLARVMSRAHYGSAHGASAEGYSIRAALRRHLREVVRGARVGTVLDVGCGYGALCGGAVTGIDTDPVVIAAARRRHVDPGLTFLLADAATLCCPVSGQPVALGEYDTVVCAHSLHNAAVNPESWEAWGANITKLGTKVLVVAFVSADVFGEAGRVEFGTSWAQRIADGTGEVPGTCLARRSLAWTASAGRPLVEPFVTETAVVDLFSKHGWVLKQASQPDPCPVDGWAKWVAHTHVLTFAR